MEVGSIEHVVAQMTHKKPSAEVAMKRLSQEFVTSYLFHLLLIFVNFCGKVTEKWGKTDTIKNKLLILHPKRD